MPAYQNVAIQTAVNTALSTSTEKQLIDSGRVSVSMATMRAVVTAVCNITAAVGTTQVVANLYRGSGILGVQVQQSNVTLVAGNSGDVNVCFSEQVRNQDFAEYTFSVQALGATGSGNVVWAILRVDLING